MKRLLIVCVVLFAGLVAVGQKPFKVGVQLWTFHDVDFTTAMEKAHAAGLDRVQAFPGQKLGGGRAGAMGAGMTLEDVIYVTSLAKKLGITIDSYGVAGAKGKDEWEGIFKILSKLRVPLLTAEPAQADLDVVDQLAGKYGIRVAIHNHPDPSPYWEPSKLLEVMKTHKNIGACADLGHWVRSGLKADSCLALYGNRVWNVHFKDVPRMEKEAEDVMPGAGIIQLPAVFDILRRNGFNGTLTIEYETKWGQNDGDVKEMAAWLRKQ
ncbi:MAG: sugar phosphate isomerase/epimerase [Flavihumibacter sp.]